MAGRDARCGHSGFEHSIPKLCLFDHPYLINVYTLHPELVYATYMQFLAERSLCTNLCVAKYCMPTATSRHIPMSIDSDSP